MFHDKYNNNFKHTLEHYGRNFILSTKYRLEHFGLPKKMVLRVMVMFDHGLYTFLSFM